MEKRDYVDCLRADSDALAAAAGLGLTEPVASCPGWSVADLVVHTGGVQRAQANIVATRAREPAGMKREMFESVPGLVPWLEHSVLMGGQSDLDAIPTGLIDWFLEGAAALIEALSAADPDEPVWSWSQDQRVAHYLRLLPIETAVHRWDAQLAHDRMQPIDRALAVDGIDHTFEVMMPFRRRVLKAPAGRGERFRFVQTDGSEYWTAVFAEEPTILRTSVGDADVTLAGSGSDLFLFLWQRIPGNDLEVRGDPRLLDRYFELVPPL